MSALEVHLGWGRLDGSLAKLNPLSYSRIAHARLGPVGGPTISRDPEAGTAVVQLGGLHVEGPEELFVPGLDGVGRPYLERALPPPG